MEEYKGIYYNDNSEKRYYEGGAHFRYSDLVKALSILQRKNAPQKSSIDLQGRCNVIYKLSPMKKEGRNYSNNNNNIRLSYKTNSNNTNHSIKSYRAQINKNSYSIYSRNIKLNNIEQIKTMNIVPRFIPIKNHYHHNSQINLENKSSSVVALMPIVNNRMNSQKSMIEINNKRSRNLNIMQKTNSLIKTDIFRNNSLFYKKNNFNHTLLNMNLKKKIYH